MDGKPGKLVNNWGAGNWSGDAEGRLQTMRSAACIAQSGKKKYLTFAAFTSATPNSMAKVLQSYGCQTAMHLDMNAYMYLHAAVFKYAGKNLDIEYLHQKMRYPKRVKKHRYILDNNNRDFFYVYRK